MEHVFWALVRAESYLIILTYFELWQSGTPRRMHR